MERQEAWQFEIQELGEMILAYGKPEAGQERKTDGSERYLGGRLNRN